MCGADMHVSALLAQVYGATESSASGDGSEEVVEEEALRKRKGGKHGGARSTTDGTRVPGAKKQRAGGTKGRCGQTVELAGELSSGSAAGGARLRNQRGLGRWC